VLAVLSTGHKLGLGLAGLAFVIFALVSAMVLGHRDERFPGDRLNAFIAVCVLFFVGMLAAVYVFGKSTEPPEKHNNEPTAAAVATRI
jgi:hypothetical protein